MKILRFGCFSHYYDVKYKMKILDKTEFFIYEKIYNMKNVLLDNIRLDINRFVRNVYIFNGI